MSGEGYLYNPFVMHSVPYTRLIHLTLLFDVKSLHGVAEINMVLIRDLSPSSLGYERGWGIVSHNRGRVRGATR